jgi:hypothetical protein
MAHMTNRIVTVNTFVQSPGVPSTLQSTGALVSQGGTILTPGTSQLLTQLSDLTPYIAGGKAVTILSWLAGTATATIPTGHGLTIGDSYWITLTGVTPAAWNGVYFATATSATVLTFAIPTNPGTATVFGVVTAEDVSELVAMATTFFAQGASQSIYVLEFGAGNATDGVTALSNYLTAHPNTQYVPGASGFFYAYLVPRIWDGLPAFIALCNTFTSPVAKTYFFITTTLATYNLYAGIKSVFALIESPVFNAGSANVLTAAVFAAGTVPGYPWAAGTVTFTTSTAHNVTPGTVFQIAGCTPASYNGYYTALPGTTGSTIVGAAPVIDAALTIPGQLVAQYATTAGVSAIEFSAASPLYKLLFYAPSATNKVTPFAFTYLYGVTPFSSLLPAALLSNLKTANVNWVGTGSQGGLSSNLLLWGTAMDGNDLSSWYRVDWVELNLDSQTANAVILGSNNPLAPLNQNQLGVDQIQAVAAAIMSQGITFGMVRDPIVQTALDGPVLATAILQGVYKGFTVVNAIPFSIYSAENPTDFSQGRYAGLSVYFTVQRGFTNIVYNVTVTF